MAFGVIRNQKEEIFKKVYYDYYAPLCLYAKGLVEDSEAAQDLVSDLFVHLWETKSAQELEGPDLLSFLKISLRNSCLNYLRHLTYVRSHEEQVLSQETPQDTSTEEILTLNQLYEQLWNILNALPEEYRQSFVSSTFEGKTYAEVAEQLHVSEKTVMRYKQKVMDLLKQELKDYLPLLLLLIG